LLHHVNNAVTVVYEMVELHDCFGFIYLCYTSPILPTKQFILIISTCDNGTRLDLSCSPVYF